ncbi:hypothetical protein J1614_006301 [Plenodomus biglobosus]|nr:hypothetical protein J1614_006301 [Plenodomus biglobosus]
MARKGGNSTQRMAPPPIHHGSSNAHANALPPPSTIAAQILHNASNVHARLNAEAKVSFGELVKEFLQHPNTDEPDSQLVALISVISEAGLEGLFKDDPFAQDQQRQQGVDSIDALKIIIEQKPHLLMSTKDGDEQGGPRPPLLLWLFPKLLRLLTHTTLQFVHHPAQELLGLCLGVLVQTSALWRQIRAALRLYKSCVQSRYLQTINNIANEGKAILVELNCLDDTPSLRRQKFYIPLPSSSTISEFWTESQQFVALPHDLQAVLASPLVAIYVGLRLLLAIVSATCSENRKQAGPASFEHEVLWAMDSTIILWQSFNRRTTASDKQSLRDEIVMLYLQLIEALTVSAAGPENYFSNSPKAAQALVKSLTSFIEQDSFLTVSESNQLQLASLFTRLRSSLLSLSSCTSVLQGRQVKNRPKTLEVLETSIARFCQSTELFSAVHKDLQVGLKDSK